MVNLESLGPGSAGGKKVKKWGQQKFQRAKQTYRWSVEEERAAEP